MNKEAIITHIRASEPGISRAELAEALGLSRSTVSTVVNELLAAGLVVERGAGPSRGGRRPIVLQVNPDAGRVVGLDIGATHLAGILANLHGVVLAEAEQPLVIERGPEPCLEQVEALVGALLDRAQVGLAAVAAIGVGVPGPVIAERGIVSAPPIMPGWDGFPIRERLRERWRKPVLLDNDADLGALGEWAFGAGRGVNNLAYIKIATGIGCGLLLNGALYRGVLGTAGEIGHVTVSDIGPPCSCGGYGCLEAMASGRAIAQRAQLAVKAGQRTQLACLAAEREVTARDVAAAAAAGDAVSQQLLGDAGRHIGSALAGLVNLLDVGLVILGGGVTEAGGYLLDPLWQAVRERTLLASRQSTRVVPAALGRRSVALGAVWLALDHTFHTYAAARPAAAAAV